MRDIIQRHNRLNGVVFSIVEFTVIALFIGAFASYYLFHHRFFMAFIGCGITLNCLPVIIYGFRQLAQNRASGRHIGSFWDRKSRDQHRRENPHMSRDTLTLTLATLLPFVGLAAVALNLPKPAKP